MRILFLGDYENKEIVPAPIKVGKELFKSFKNSGHHIFYLPYFQDGRLYSRMKKLFGFEKIAERVYRTGIFPLIIFVLKFKPQVIHIFTPGLYYIVLFPLRLIFNFKIISTVHSINRYVLNHLSNLKGYQKFRFLVIDYFLIKFSDCVFVYSGRDKRYISMYYKVNPDKITVVNNGFNELNILRQDHEFKLPLKIAFVGQINRKEKGFELLINALQLLNIPVKLSVYSHDKQLDMESKKLKNVEMQFRNPLPENEFRKELIKSYLFILPSNYESFSIALLEAMSTGMLFIVSNRVGMTERFQDEMTEFVFRKKNVQHLLSRIKYFLDLKNEQKMKLSSKIVDFTKKYSWDKIADNYIKIYQEILIK